MNIEMGRFKSDAHAGFSYREIFDIYGDIVFVGEKVLKDSCCSKSEKSRSLEISRGFYTGNKEADSS